MPRQSILALGLLTTLALLVGLAGRPALAEDPVPQTKTVTATPGHVAEAHPAAPAASDAHGHAAATKSEAHGAGDATHAEAQPNILEPQPSLAIWTVAVFVILLLILGRFAWGPILQALHDREEHMQQCLIDAEKARNEAERIMAENRKFLAQAADEVRSIIEQGRSDAQASADAILQKAQADADASLVRAEREIQSARDQALTDIFSKTADLAVSVASKVLSKQLDEPEHRRLIESAIQELPASPNGNGVRA
jgi:F-type H+-transporting ATPase subunit b